MLTNEFCVREKFWEKDPHTHSPPPLSVVGVSNTFHILISCPFSKKVWTKTSSSLRQRSIWTGDTLELAWKNWSRYPRNKELKTLPLLISWGIWLAHNATIFK